MPSFSDLKSRYDDLTRAVYLAQERGDMDAAFDAARQAVAIKRKLDIAMADAGFHLMKPARVH